MGHTVFYHGNCIDGFVSACNLKNTLGQTPHFHPISYGRAGDFFKHYDIDSHIHTVWFINICIKGKHLQEILDQGFNVVVIDTHSSSIEQISEVRNDENATRLRYIIGRSGYCTSSLISALGVETLRSILHLDVGMPRVEVGRLDNGRLEAQFLCNISTRSLDRNRLTPIDRVLECYTLAKSPSTPQYYQGQALHFWMLQYDIQLERPVADITTLFTREGVTLQTIVDVHGKIITDTHRRTVMRAIGAGMVDKVKVPEEVQFIVSMVPDGLEDFFGEVYNNRTMGKCIAVAVLVNGSNSTTGISIRSETVDVLHIARRLYGGGDERRAGTTLSGTHHSLHEIKYLIKGALQHTGEKIQDSIKAA